MVFEGGHVRRGRIRKKEKEKKKNCREGDSVDDSWEHGPKGQVGNCV